MIIVQLTVLKAKLHKACVTHVEPDYDGSCAIDGAMLDRAGIHEYEQVQIYNITNGERFTTYAIRADANSGIISINGAAAHKASCRDRIIICSYAVLDEKEMSTFKPVLIYLDERNHILRIRDSIPVQAA